MHQLRWSNIGALMNIKGHIRSGTHTANHSSH